MSLEHIAGRWAQSTPGDREHYFRVIISPGPHLDNWLESVRDARSISIELVKKLRPIIKYRPGKRALFFATLRAKVGPKEKIERLRNNPKRINPNLIPYMQNKGASQRGSHVETCALLIDTRSDTGLVRNLSVFVTQPTTPAEVFAHPVLAQMFLPDGTFMESVEAARAYCAIRLGQPSLSFEFELTCSDTNNPIGHEFEGDSLGAAFVFALLQALDTRLGGGRTYSWSGAAATMSATGKLGGLVSSPWITKLVALGKRIKLNDSNVRLMFLASSTKLDKDATDDQHRLLAQPGEAGKNYRLIGYGSKGRLERREEFTAGSLLLFFVDDFDSAIQDLNDLEKEILRAVLTKRELLVNRFIRYSNLIIICVLAFTVALICLIWWTTAWVVWPLLLICPSFCFVILYGIGPALFKAVAERHFKGTSGRKFQDRLLLTFPLPTEHWSALLGTFGENPPSCVRTFQGQMKHCIQGTRSHFSASDLIQNVWRRARHQTFIAILISSALILPIVTTSLEHRIAEAVASSSRPRVYQCKTQIAPELYESDRPQQTPGGQDQILDFEVVSGRPITISFPRQSRTKRFVNIERRSGGVTVSDHKFNKGQVPVNDNRAEFTCFRREKSDDPPEPFSISISLLDHTGAILSAFVMNCKWVN